MLGLCCGVLSGALDRADQTLEGRACPRVGGEGGEFCRQQCLGVVLPTGLSQGLGGVYPKIREGNTTGLRGRVERLLKRLDRLGKLPLLERDPSIHERTHGPPGVCQLGGVSLAPRQLELLPAQRNARDDLVRLGLLRYTSRSVFDEPRLRCTASRDFVEEQCAPVCRVVLADYLARHTRFRGGDGRVTYLTSGDPAAVGARAAVFTGQPLPFVAARP